MVFALFLSKPTLMKPATILILLGVYLFSCKKDDIDPNEVRLLAVTSVLPTGETNNMQFTYDGNGRITKVTSNTNAGTLSPRFSISYSGNEILMVSPPLTTPGVTGTDSIKLYLRPDGNIDHRIVVRYYELFGPNNLPQRSYYYDTTHYQYDGAGLRTGFVFNWLDTTWFNPGQVTTHSSRTNGNFTMINSNGNLVQQSGSAISVWTTFNSTGGSSTMSRIDESSEVYEYSKSYPNKMDFKNAAVLEQLYLFNTPINPRYKNLPDKISYSQVSKNPNGTIISTNAFSMIPQHTFNSYGFVKTRFFPAAPNEKMTFVYNK